MQNDELEKIWQNSIKGEGVDVDKTKILGELNSQLNNFDRVIKKRDIREIIAAIIVIILFGAGAFIFTDILSRIGMVLGVLYGILVVYVLKNVRKHKPANNALPIKDFLIEYQLYLTKERNLLANVIYWYLIPPFIACFLFFLGQNLSISQLFFFMLIIFCLYAFIFFLNRMGVKKSFDPLLKNLGDAINTLEEIEEKS